jgi:hypothetical protein
MANQSVQKRPTTPLPSCLVHNCLNCRSERPCPPLILVAMRYAQEIASYPSEESSNQVLALPMPTG